MIYKIPCKNCDCVYIGQTRRKLTDKITEYQRACKSQGLHSKLYQHALNFDQIPAGLSF